MWCSNDLSFFTVLFVASIGSGYFAILFALISNISENLLLLAVANLEIRLTYYYVSELTEFSNLSIILNCDNNKILEISISFTLEMNSVLS